MHLVVLFQNVGGYHAARLRALQDLCHEKDWKLTAVQVTDNAREHEWGSLGHANNFDLRTLLPAAKPLDVERGEGAGAAKQALRNFLDSAQPDVVAIPGWGSTVARSAHSWAKSHRALAILMSESKRDDHKRSWWKEQLKSRVCVRRFDAALVGGQLHRDYLIELGFPGDRIFLGYDVVDNEYFAERAASARIDPSAARHRDGRIPVRPFFLAVTRFIERKNVVRLIQAFAAYRRQMEENEAWELAICGSGEEESRIRQAIADLNLQKFVHLPGFVSYEQIGDWYGLASAFVHPASQEQWGLVVNEACSAGLPVLCSRTVGARHDLVRENENGWLFDPESQEEMTRALTTMHRLDLSVRSLMGRSSQIIVAGFTPQRFAIGFLSAIQAASASNGTTSKMPLTEGAGHSG
jgi:glycosyltransferase involved in cell wall biosynthesis